MEITFLFEIFLPIAGFLALSVLFVMMFISNNWCDCRKKDEKAEAANSHQVNTHNRSHGNGSGESDVTFIDLPSFTCCSLQQASDSLHAIHLHRSKKEDDPPPTYEMAVGYLTHEHHSCLHLV